MQKGETLTDTIRTMECYADAVVLRHPREGSVEEAAGEMRSPLTHTHTHTYTHTHTHTYTHIHAHTHTHTQDGSDDHS